MGRLICIYVMSNHIAVIMSKIIIKSAKLYWINTEIQHFHLNYIRINISY